MPRSKNRVASRQRRKRILKANAGYYGKRKNCIRTASDSFWRAGVYAYAGRKQKKRHFRSLWIVRINAAARLNGMSYSAFMNGLKKSGVELNRKTLAHLAMHEPDAFKKLAEQARA